MLQYKEVLLPGRGSGIHTASGVLACGLQYITAAALPGVGVSAAGDVFAYVARHSKGTKPMTVANVEALRCPDARQALIDPLALLGFDDSLSGSLLHLAVMECVKACLPDGEAVCGQLVAQASQAAALACLMLPRCPCTHWRR